MTQRAVTKRANLTQRQADAAVGRYLAKRTKPYTDRGIKRVPCARCGKPSQHQWNACALGSQYFGVCRECDIGLNRVALEYMKIANAAELIAEYERSLP